MVVKSVLLVSSPVLVMTVVVMVLCCETTFDRSPRLIRGHDPFKLFVQRLPHRRFRVVVCVIGKTGVGPVSLSNSFLYFCVVFPCVSAAACCLAENTLN